MASLPTSPPSGKSSRPRCSEKAEQAAQRILDVFRSGNLPQALAPIFINRRDNVPCRSWSWSNQLLTALAGYSDARSYRDWQAVGRQVKKGEKSFHILEPCLRTFTKRDKETGEETKVTIVKGFKAGPRFGLEQTEGEPLPGPDPKVANWLESLPLREVAEKWGLSVDAYNGKNAGYLGYYRHGQSIALGVENWATWAHELVHAADDKAGTITKAHGQQPDNEIVAELGGAVLLEVLGHTVESDRGGAWQYITHYAESARLDPVQACQRLLNRICSAVALILDTAESMAREGECNATA
ncbi:MAG: ArdC family protein [bacterium]|nr:ArdC family protein [bacterium]